MQNLLFSSQIREADDFTIRHEPISSVDLMERASKAFVEAFVQRFPDTKKAISIYCGTGNNGGDGLAIARLLQQAAYNSISVKIARFNHKSSTDFQVNFERLKQCQIPFTEIKKTFVFPPEPAEIIIDALLGSGLNKPLGGNFKNLALWLNGLNRQVISVDVPTGFKSEGEISPDDVAIKSTLVITFQRPKINFLLPESAAFMDEFLVVDIGLNEDFIKSLNTDFTLLGDADIKQRLKKRKAFDHKGTFGHTLVIAGAPETMGAALLCAEASLRTGSGLTTACIPAEGLIALNTRIPEVMAAIRTKGYPEKFNWDRYSSVAIGPGLGASEDSLQVLSTLLEHFKKPIVFDADAINLLAGSSACLTSIPKGSVLTPHLKEFDRLFGEHENWWSRLEKGKLKAKELACFIVLKNRYTIIFTPGGKCIFNPTGSPAMASGGMGDVLTGIIASFLAQGYSAEDAVLSGVFLHGRAGEFNNAYVATATDVLANLQTVIKNYL